MVMTRSQKVMVNKIANAIANVPAPLAPRTRKVRKNKGVKRGTREEISKRAAEMAAAKKLRAIARANAIALKIGEKLNKERAKELRATARAVKLAKKANSDAVKIGERLNKERTKKVMAAAKANAAPVKIGVRLDRERAKAMAATQREAMRLNRVLKLIAKRRKSKLSNQQKAQALLNAAVMTSKNLKAKYIQVTPRGPRVKKTN